MSTDKKRFVYRDIYIIISSTADKNLWLVFQYKREAFELAMGAVLLYCTADFRMLWKCMKHI